MSRLSRSSYFVMAIMPKLPSRWRRGINLPRRHSIWRTGEDEPGSRHARDRAWQDFQRGLAEFGLTPTARSRVALPRSATPTRCGPCWTATA